MEFRRAFALFRRVFTYKCIDHVFLHIFWRISVILQFIRVFTCRLPSILQFIRVFTCKRRSVLQFIRVFTCKSLSQAPKQRHQNVQIIRFLPFKSCFWAKINCARTRRFQKPQNVQIIRVLPFKSRFWAAIERPRTCPSGPGAVLKHLYRYACIGVYTRIY